MSTNDKKTYMSKGRVLERPPLTVRISRFFESAYVFFGLYLVSLFSLDPYVAAQNSQFNVTGSANSGTRTRLGGGGGPGRRIGEMSDIPGPAFGGGGCGC